MPRSCFSPSRKLLNTCYPSPQTSYEKPVKLGITKSQRKWQKVSWGFYIDFTLGKKTPHEWYSSEQELVEMWKLIYKKCDMAEIPKPCVFFNLNTLNYWFGYSPYAEFHHIVPKGYAWKIDPFIDPDNEVSNIIPLEPDFHNGKGKREKFPVSFDQIYPGQLLDFPCVHPDCAIAGNLAEQVGWYEALSMQREFQQDCYDLDIPPHNYLWDKLFMKISLDRLYCFETLVKIPYPDSAFVN